MRLVGKFVNQFKKRSREEYHFIILSSLLQHGPLPPTVLAYCSELNIWQANYAVEFLLEIKAVSQEELTDNLRSKLSLRWGLSSKTVISITEKGRKYLELLLKLQSQIDWKTAHEVNSKRKRAIKQRLKK